MAKIHNKYARTHAHIRSRTKQLTGVRCYTRKQRNQGDEKDGRSAGRRATAAAAQLLATDAADAAGGRLDRCGVVSAEDVVLRRFDRRPAAAAAAAAAAADGPADTAQLCLVAVPIAGHCRRRQRLFRRRAVQFNPYMITEMIFQ